MEELVGFAASNHKASKILAVLDSKGPLNRSTIAKTIRIVGADKSLDELVEKKLIVLDGEKYCLTDMGKEVTHKLRGV
ncbi:MAG: transcriptional regulator [Candidatus Methanoperedens sp.]|nr:transcriptional regulator [Candidatus Methanoperedens sp.]MCE8428710.1 transcriptional regulator [Candidatus Methanoperedens sp.]